mgnify:CR=1 FL=1
MSTAAKRKPPHSCDGATALTVTPGSGLVAVGDAPLGEIIGGYLDRDLVADGYRVGGAYAADAEVTFDLAVKDISRIRLDGIAIAGVAYDESVHVLRE